MSKQPKMHHVMGKYDWSEVIMIYMGSNEVKCMDMVIRMTPKVDKAAPAIYGQLIADAWGLA